MKYLLLILISVIWLFVIPVKAEAKSYVRSYMRSGTKVRSYIRYKADGYRFNNYQFRYDRGYRR